MGMIATILVFAGVGGMIGFGWWVSLGASKRHVIVAAQNDQRRSTEVTRPTPAVESPKAHEIADKGAEKLPPTQTAPLPNGGKVPNSTTGNTEPSKTPARADVSTLDKESKTEVERRRLLLGRLRNEYILSHDGISPALMAGTEQPPTDWTNKRLGELGEKWKMPITSPSSATTPTVENDVHETLASGRLAQGWTLHKHGDVWTIYFIMDTDQLNAPLIQAIDGTEVKIALELTTKTTAMWSDIRLKVPAPEPVRTEYGIVEGQEFVEHMTRYFRESNTIQWTYEVMQNGTGITPRPQVIRHILAAELSPADRETIGELDALAVHAVNRRYIDAMVKISK
jgi:hypothetical protein